MESESSTEDNPTGQAVAENRKRAAIIAVHQDNTLLPREKQRRIQTILRETDSGERPVLTGERVSREKSVSETTPTTATKENACDMDDDQNAGMELDLAPVASHPSQPSFYTKTAASVFGCEHVRRDVFLLAPCCKKWYVCRECHDDEEDHAMNRKEVARQFCMHCMQETPVSGVCTSEPCAGRSLAYYYCDVCHCHRKETDLRFWHCDQCGLCRVAARGTNYAHCNRCNLCVPADETACVLPHTCMLRPSETQTCPVCTFGIHSSTKPVLTLPCGHPIHAQCLQEMHTQSGTYRCPLCKRSTNDMALVWDEIDRILQRTVMPEPQRYWTAHVGCNDCLEHTLEANFHYHGLKCGNGACGSYNTYVVELFKRDTPEGGEIQETREEEAEQALVIAEASIEAAEQAVEEEPPYF